MADNGRIRQAKELIRKCNLSVLTESDFGRNYTNSRRDRHNDRTAFNAYRTLQTTHMDSSPILKTLKLEQSTENEPQVLSKKKAHLN